MLQQGNTCFCKCLIGFVAPDACLYLADVGVANQQHAQTALADTATDGIG